ncbi:MAG: CHASE2 domain-containing protein [Cyanobacteria bacterium P01_A01_bin.135]
MNQRWYGAAMPGAICVGAVIAARLLGWLQPLELAALDAGLRWRKPEPTDSRVTVVGINEADIQATGTYPIPDGVLAALLRQLQASGAVAIGLDIVRDVPVEPGHGELVAAFKSMDNVIAPRTAVPDRNGAAIQPPPSLPPEQVGLVDAVLDIDGNHRRALLGSPTDEGFQFSMPFKLAERYLAQRGISLENGIRDPWAMRFGSVELPRIQPNSGGYVGADAGGVQTLLNFRSGETPFHMVSMTEVLEGQAPELVRDRVVLIGVTSLSAKDITPTAAVNSANPGLVFGVEVQAHATSQILSAVLDGRSLLRTWPDFWEYGWILFWGAFGIGLCQYPHRLRYHGLLVVVVSATLGAISYGALLSGWWLPVVPALMALLLITLVIYPFQRYDRALRSRIDERQLVIDQTFTAIHNGPLQRLAVLIRQVEEAPPTQQGLQQDLRQLNRELRSVCDAVKEEIAQDDLLYLRGQSTLEMTTPLHELLYQVYSDVLQRDLAYLAAVKLKITKFEPFDEVSLLPTQKRELCRLLEEMLCNVGKHAAGTNRLIIDCHHNGAVNIIRVVDNGAGLPPATNAQVKAAAGRGTQQAQALARQLNAVFERSPHRPKGTRCELRWKPKRSLLQRIRERLVALRKSAR